jgi:hypothetical protein
MGQEESDGFPFRNGPFSAERRSPRVSACGVLVCTPRRKPLCGLAPRKNPSFLNRKLELVPMFSANGDGCSPKGDISKNSTGHCSGLIFDGLHHQTPGRISRSDDVKRFSNPQRSVRLLRTE